MQWFPKPYNQELEHREKYLKDIFFFEDDGRSSKQWDHYIIPAVFLEDKKNKLRLGLALSVVQSDSRSLYFTTSFDLKGITTKHCFGSLICLLAVNLIVTTNGEWTLGYTRTKNLRLILLTTLGNKAVLLDLPLPCFSGNSWIQKLLVNQQNVHKIKIMCRQKYVGQRSLIIAYEHLKRPLWEDNCWGLKYLLPENFANNLDVFGVLQNPGGQ